MFTAGFKFHAAFALVFALATTAASQDSNALINALIRKGILTSGEAEEIRAELLQESQSVTPPVSPEGKSTKWLRLGMRMQMQYAHLDSDIRDVFEDPAATNHAFLRRMYLTLRAGLGGNWGASLTYDLASNGYDQATIGWKPSSDLSFDFGLRKVNVAHEERASSGDLRAIERSGVTRYFVESNNGRRLGAASYRVGVFLDGRMRLSDAVGFLYGAAITTPERNETFSFASSSGNGSNNKPAFWANAGLTGTLAAGGSWRVEAGAGHVPDQGGLGAGNIGLGFDISIYSVHAGFDVGRLGLAAEYLIAKVEQGGFGARDATPSGFFVQPRLRLTDTLEAVVRYQRLDTDGRGVQLSDVIRSAPTGPTMDRFDGWFAGANWYLRGNDLKYQLGLEYGKTRDTVTGAPAEAETVGVRSQMQVQF